PAAEGEMPVYFFDVGQGDSTLLAGPDFTVVIDAGRHDRTDVVPHLRRAGVESIDLLVGTHPDPDHIGQLADVLAAFPVPARWLARWPSTPSTSARGTRPCSPGPTSRSSSTPAATTAPTSCPISAERE